MRSVVLPTLLSLWLICQPPSAQGFYVVPGTSIASASAAIINLLRNEEEMVEILLRHILTPMAKGDHKIIELKNMLSKVQRHLPYMPGDGTDEELQRFVAHPINAYQLIKGWAQVGDILAAPPESNNVVKAKESLLKAGFRVPTSLDSNAAINQILQLQSIYRLNVTEMAAGNINDVRSSQPLDEMDYYLFGRAAFFYRHYHYAVDWLQLATDEDVVKHYQTHIAKEVQYTLYKIYRADKQWLNAERSLEAAAEMDHRDKPMWDELAKFKQQLFIEKPKKLPLDLYERSKTYNEGLFKRLCRTKDIYLPVLKHEEKSDKEDEKDEDKDDDKEKKDNTEEKDKEDIEEKEDKQDKGDREDELMDETEDKKKKVKRDLKKKTTKKPKKSKKPWKQPRGFCRYRAGQGAYVTYQEEVFSIKPLVSIFHRVFQTNDTDYLTEIAEPKLTVHTTHHEAGDATLVHSSHRTWLVDDKDTVLGNITTRLDDVFYDKCRKPTQTLDDALEKHKIVTWYQCSDPLQVYNYGIGGFSTPHVEGVNEVSETLLEGGHRQVQKRTASTIIFLTDVEAGGEFVFTSIRLRIRPEKGSVLYWETLDGDREPQRASKYGECPVLFGEKWVARRAIHHFTVKKHLRKYEICSPKDAPKKDKDSRRKSKHSDEL